MQVEGSEKGVWISPHYSLEDDLILRDDKQVVGQAEHHHHVVVSVDEHWLAYFFNQTLCVMHKDMMQFMLTNVDVYRLDWIDKGRVCFSTTDKRRWIYSLLAKEELSMVDSLYDQRVFSVNEELYVIFEYDKYWIKDKELGFAPVWYDGKRFLPAE